MSELMKCGHTANATQISKDGTKKPCCIICNCIEVDDDKPDLIGRKAKCTDCGNIEISSYDLPFFKHNRGKQYDGFYCGCRGWN